MFFKGAQSVQIRWTERMYQFLRDNFQRMEDREIAAFFTRSCGIRVNVRMVEHARARLGLIKYRLNAGGSDEPQESESPVSPEILAAWDRAKQVKEKGDGGGGGET